MRDPLEGGSAWNPLPPIHASTQPGRRGPRRDQTGVRQPHSRRMRHAEKSHVWLTDPPAATEALQTLSCLRFESSFFSLCANSHSLESPGPHLPKKNGRTCPGLLGGLVRTSSRCLADGLASGLFSGVDYVGTQGCQAAHMQATSARAKLRKAHELPKTPICQAALFYCKAKQIFWLDHC